VNLDRVGGPEEGGKEGYGVGGRPIGVPEKGKSQGIEDEKKEEYGREVVDGKIDYMVAEDIKSTHIVVQAQTEARKRPVELSFKIEGFRDALPREVFQVDIGIVYNVGIIIEMEFSMETVPVDKEKEDEEGDKGKGIPFTLREMEGHGKREVVMEGKHQDCPPFFVLGVRR
jgi:hypothetical protein